MTKQRIASRILNIKPSPSSSAADKANELRRQGLDIISLLAKRHGKPFNEEKHVTRQTAEA